MTLQTSRFTKRNESFCCVNCNYEVPLAQSTCRDHCPRCLFSRHVDELPGDRASSCGGTLKPVGWSQQRKKGYRIHYICLLCQQKKVNKFLEQDALCPDSLAALMALSSVTTV